MLPVSVRLVSGDLKAGRLVELTWRLAGTSAKIRECLGRNKKLLG
jgi:hypothetical protein